MQCQDDMVQVVKGKKDQVYLRSTNTQSSVSDQMASMKCMLCSKKMEYVRELSAPKGKQRTYTCWKCDITYICKVKEHIMIVELTRAR